jgi:UDP-N-acetylmuramate: L-alanyl-gamma-D-glutamyl-meso-diaminopimelate ligase
MFNNVRKIYMIGICGVAMGTLAGMLKNRGYDIVGSDENVYPPMSDMLVNWGIDIRRGYREENIDSPDLVIIGNAISRGNVEAEYVLNNGITYLSMAQALYHAFLKGKEVICISGTHGKSTTTALLGHILQVSGVSPSFLIGGVSKNYNSNFKLGEGGYFVIEGDEYDSAFFEKIPKFILYRPQHLILTSLEFDHADIYKNIDEIKLWFQRLVNIVPSRGNILYSDEYPILREVVSRSLSNTFSFGAGDSDFSYEFKGYSDDHALLTLRSKRYGDVDLRTGVLGRFNYSNIAAAVSAALILGVERSDIEEAVKTFEGVKRRMELIYEHDHIRIYEDYAHHPTSIRLVLDELRSRFPDACICAIYEPRSATSRRRTFQEALSQAFGSADRVLIKTPYRLEVIPEGERIDIHAVIAALHERDQDAELFESVDDIVDDVFSRFDSSRLNVVIVMSNGGFDGIYKKIVDRVKQVL